MTLNSKLQLALCRREKKPISHQPKTPKLHNGQIPAEILDLIYKHLPALEQIYFALTCKYIYTYFVSFLKKKDPDHAKHLIPRRKRLPILHNAKLEAHPRIQLLRQLENERWKCCVVCMKLHSPLAFKPSKQYKKESHCYKCSLLYGRDCMPYAGLVDICPCVSMTFNERQLVVNTISSSSEPSIFPKDFKHDSAIKRYFHECQVTNHLYAQLSIETRLSLSSKSNSLYVRNTYTFEFSKGLSDALSGICPHKETSKWLRQFFTETGLNYSAWGGTAKPLATEPHLIKIITTRKLGHRNWNRRGWKNNRNDRG